MKEVSIFLMMLLWIFIEDFITLACVWGFSEWVNLISINPLKGGLV